MIAVVVAFLPAVRDLIRRRADLEAELLAFAIRCSCFNTSAPVVAHGFGQAIDFSGWRWLAFGPAGARC